MAQLSTDSINLDRDDLAGFLPSLRAIKAFENLAQLASQTIPEAVNNNTTDIETLQSQAESAGALALSAFAEAAIARILAQDSQLQSMSSEIASLREDIAVLRTGLNDIASGVLL